MGQLLLRESCTVTMTHSRTRDIMGDVRAADIVAAVGIPGFVQRDWIKPGATVIDVGINRTASGGRRRRGGCGGGRRRDDPGAGGVGPMTIAVLLRNTLVAAGRRAGVTVDEAAL
ncbi:hypothetical protein AB5I41_18430 [Sphingomonas sp. MMS24-JH45]